MVIVTKSATQSASGLTTPSMVGNWKEILFMLLEGSMVDVILGEWRNPHHTSPGKTLRSWHGMTTVLRTASKEP